MNNNFVKLKRRPNVVYNHGKTPIFISLYIRASEDGSPGIMEQKIIINPGDGIDLNVINLRPEKVTLK